MSAPEYRVRETSRGGKHRRTVEGVLVLSVVQVKGLAAIADAWEAEGSAAQGVSIEGLGLQSHTVKALVDGNLVVIERGRDVTTVKPTVSGRSIVQRERAKGAA